MRKYIAYGSNLNKGQMEKRCPGAKPVAVGFLENYRLVFQGNPFGAHANVIPEEGSQVPIAIWEISRENEAALDRYEGVAGGYYTKEYIEVEVKGEREKALIYIMTPHAHGTPATSYLLTIDDGYRDFKLDRTALYEAVEFSAYRVGIME